MYTVLSGIVFFLVISDNIRMTYTQRGEACRQVSGKFRCQEVYECEVTPPKPPTCRCPIEEPVYTGKQPDCRKAHVGEECGQPFHCDTEVCTANKCQCPPESPDYDSDLKMCKSKDKAPGKGKTNGEACSKDADCNAEFLLKCEKSKCACPAKTEWKPGGCKPSKGKDKEGSAYGGPCDTAGDCMDGKGLTCTSKQCICEPGSIWDAGKCQKKPSLGGICVKDNDCEDGKSLICFNRKCECPSGLRWGEDRCGELKSIGENCTTESDCHDGQRLNCTNKKCACNPEYDWKPKSKGCEKAPPRTFDGPCSSDDHCIKVRQLVCIKNKCGCKAGFEWVEVEGFCKPKGNQEKCNPFATPKDCQKGGMECDAKKQYCTCPVGSEFSIVAKSCKLKAGENCFINNTLQHDLCASQQCITESGKKHCACPQEDGVTQTWSSGNGCITEYLNLPCAASDDECHGGTFNKHRQGLICKDNICQCDEGLTYLRGYCVLATLLFNEVCDPDGINATCRGDAELTCQDIGGGDKRCVCLLREIPVHGKKEIVALSWNADQKKCDLKPNGARCNGGYECRIGYCRETCQKGIVERPNSAEPKLKLTNHKIPTAFTLIFLIFRLN